MDGQDLVEGLTDVGDERRAVLRRRRREAGVVGGQEDLADGAVGRLGVGHAGRPQLLRQPALEGLEQRSIRPRAPGEEDRMCWMPSRESARPTWVGLLLSTGPPAFGVWK